MTYATCPACNRVMAEGVSCDPFGWAGSGGTTTPRIPYSRAAFPDVAMTEEQLSNPCSDCNAPVGGFHHLKCDLERCRHGRQALLCYQGCLLVVGDQLMDWGSAEVRQWARDRGMIPPTRLE